MKSSVERTLANVRWMHLPGALHASLPAFCISSLTHHSFVCPFAVARQAKALEAKLRIAAGEEEEDGATDDEVEDEEEAEEGAARDKRAARWGASKRAYYDADIADLEGSDEEEALADEEAEALRLQRATTAALHPDDFGAPEQEDDESESEDESDEEELTMGARTKGGSHITTVTKDDEARAAAIRQDALELSALISELRSVLGEVRGRVGPLLREVRSGDLATADGVSFLEAKHTLLIHYAASIIFYLLLKAEGRPVRDHPVIKRLVEVRLCLEKVRPIDKRLQYQIEKLLAAAQRAVVNGGGEGDGGREDEKLISHGPRPEALVSSQQERRQQQQDGGGGEGDGGDGVYRPPRLNPVSMDMEESKERRQRRKESAAARRASRSTLVQELAAEITGGPEEKGVGTMPLGMDTVAALRTRQKMAAREAIEEDLMVRVPLGREERKQLKAQRRAGLSGKALLDDFADDVADLIGAGNGAGGGGGGVEDPLFSKFKTNQKFGADVSAQALRSKQVRSGDADAPVREPLPDRRAKMDGLRARQQQGDENGDGEEFDFGGARKGGNSKRASREQGGEEDAFYVAAKEAAVANKRQRQAAYSRPELLPPARDPTTDSARRINNAIEKNRGLTPHRKKELKNPRKKHRVKFAEANVRRKGQVQEVREGGGVYGGEGTGIKSKVSKSVKF